MKYVFLAFISLPVYAMDDVTRLHAAVEDVVRTKSTYALQEILQSHVNPNIPDEKGRYPVGSLKETMLWYTDNKMPIPSHLNKALQLLYDNGAFEVEQTSESEEETDEKDTDCIWSESDDEVISDEDI
ncbi:MAG: hypothetical protein WD055_03620 [Candidatus Dependentiae bacterium]